MRRTLSSIGAWLVATSIAILVAWLGVRSVQFAAVPDRIEPMSAAEARLLAPRSPTPDPEETPQPAETPSPAPILTPSPVTEKSTDPNGVEWQRVPDGKGGIALQRTFQLKGGAATIRFAEGNVRVTATAPAPGFGVSFEQRAPDVAIVIFTSPQHFSRIEAFWDGGARVKSTEGDA